MTKWLRERIASLRGARNLVYPLDMSRLLRAGRLALHLARSLVQGFLSYLGSRNAPSRKRNSGDNTYDSTVRFPTTMSATAVIPGTIAIP